MFCYGLHLPIGNRFDFPIERGFDGSQSGGTLIDQRAANAYEQSAQEPSHRFIYKARLPRTAPATRLINCLAGEFATAGAAAFWPKCVEMAEFV